jgi:alkylation response protein AidB-like acyl-CoA dehydrogenase
MPSPDFRARVRDWFAEHTPARWQAELDAASDDEFLDFNRRWLTALQSEGFAAPHVPVDWGGGGYTMTEQAVIYEEWARAQAPPLDVFAV